MNESDCNAGGICLICNSELEEIQESEPDYE